MRQPNVILILFLFSIFTLYLYLMQVYGNCNSLKMNLDSCSVYAFAKDFKELFGFVFGFITAILATEPVWRQLKLMKTDDTIKSIEFLKIEISDLAKILFESEKILGTLWNDFLHCTGSEDEFHWSLGSDAADTMKRRTDLALSNIQRLNSSSGGEQANVVQALMAEMQELISCLYDMNARSYNDFFNEGADPQIDLEIVEKNAYIKIDSRIANFHKAMEKYMKFLKGKIVSLEKMVAERRELVLGEYR